jgi:hypothetical protein
MEQILPGKKKMIVDSTKGRRHLMLIEDGLELTAPAAAITNQPVTIPTEEQER